MLVLALPGCAVFRDEAAPADPPPASTTDEARAGQVGAVGDSTEASAAFDIRVEAADDDLRQLIERHNELQR